MMLVHVLKTNSGHVYTLLLEHLTNYDLVLQLDTFHNVWEQKLVGKKPQLVAILLLWLAQP